MNNVKSILAGLICFAMAACGGGSGAVPAPIQTVVPTAVSTPSTGNVSIVNPYPLTNLSTSINFSNSSGVVPNDVTSAGVYTINNSSGNQLTLTTYGANCLAPIPRYIYPGQSISIEPATPGACPLTYFFQVVAYDPQTGLWNYLFVIV